MVDALVSGASAERRVGSSPILGTSKEFSFQKAPFRLPRIGLVQRVAPRLTCLRSVVVCYANIRVCCAMWLKINFRPIAHQPRQSSIATTSLWSALGCCRRSSPGEVVFQFSELRRWSRRRLKWYALVSLAE